MKKNPALLIHALWWSNGQIDLSVPPPAEPPGQNLPNRRWKVFFFAKPPTPPHYPNARGVPHFLFFPTAGRPHPPATYPPIRYEIALPTGLPEKNGATAGPAMLLV